MPVEPGILTQILQEATALMNAGFLHLTPHAKRLLAVMTSIEVISAALLWMFALEDAVSGFVFRAMQIGFTLHLIVHLDVYTMALSDSFIQLGLIAGGKRMTLEQFRDPSLILHDGMRLTAPIVWSFAQGGLWDTLTNIYALLPAAVAGLFTLFVYIVMAAHILISLLEFHLFAVVATVLLPFGVTRWTAFLTERMYGWFAAAAVRLMVSAFFLSLIRPMMLTFALPSDPTFVQMFSLVAASLVFLVLAWVYPSYAAGYVAGGPNTSGHALLFASGLAGSSATRLLVRVSRPVVRSAWNRVRSR